MATYSTKTAWDGSINYLDHAKTNDYTNDTKYQDPSTEAETRQQLSSLPNELLDYVNEMLNVDKDGTPIKFRLDSAKNLQYRTGSDGNWDDTASATGTLPDYGTKTDYDACTDQGNYYLDETASNRPVSAKMHLVVFVKKVNSTSRIVQIAFPIASSGTSTDNYWWRTINGSTPGTWLHVANASDVSNNTTAIETINTAITNTITPALVPWSSTFVDNLNDAKTTGRYAFQSSATNKPSTTSGDLIVLACGLSIVQIATNRSNTSKMWVRNTNANSSPSWGNWVLVADQELTSDISGLNTKMSQAETKISNLETATAKDNGNKTITESSGTSTANTVNYVKKFGSVVNIVWRFTAPSTGTSGDTLGTLPSGYEPFKTQFHFAVNRDDVYEDAVTDNKITNKLFEVRINTDGTIKFNTAYTASRVYELCCTFITA